MGAHGESPELDQRLQGPTDPGPTAAYVSMREGVAIVTGRYRSTRPTGSVLVLGVEAECSTTVAPRSLRRSEQLRCPQY
jgi:hypothetical protein